MTAAEIYYGSDGEATRAFYAELGARGLGGAVAARLFHAQKASGRLKLYHGGPAGGGTCRGLAYARKNEALEKLSDLLLECAAVLGMRWGWKRDPGTPGFEHVLYIELPNGQVSFHAACRYAGPDYEGEWDGERVTAARILIYCDQVLELPAAAEQLWLLL